MTSLTHLKEIYIIDKIDIIDITLTKNFNFVNPIMIDKINIIDIIDIIDTSKRNIYE